MTIKKVAILPYTGPQLERVQKTYALTAEVRTWLENQGVGVATTLKEIKRGFRPDLVCVLGGDGMFVGIIRELIDLQVPFLGVNFGTKGFLLPIQPEEFRDFLSQLLRESTESIEFEERVALQATLIKNGQKRGTFVCINDVVIKSDFYLISLEVREGGKVRIRPRADGVIIATPTGSTAYNFNASGIPLAWDSPNLAVTSIACSDRVDAKCLVGIEKKIEVELLSGRAAFICDGVVPEGGPIWLNQGDIVEVQTHPQTFRVLIPSGFDSYERMKKLLN